jgi:O-antigen biosynthesis protein
MIQLSIIIVNYNVQDFLAQTLVSVRKAIRTIECEIFVVDNGSNDGSVELIRNQFPEVKLIANQENVGFGAANNQALRLAQGKFFVILNPDTVVQEDTFQVLINFLNEHPECGMVGCKILNPDGSLQLACRRSFPTPWVGLTKVIGLSRLFPKSRLFGKYNLTYLDPDHTHEVEAISGSFMMVRKEAVAQVGHFDESFFMYGEDLDWCYRIKEAGWKIFYVPATKIIHFKGESSKKSYLDLTLMFYKAMQLFVEKHFKSRYFFLPQWFLITGIVLRAGLTFLGKFLQLIFPTLLDLIFINSALVLALFFRFGNLVHLPSYQIVSMIYSIIWLISLSIFGAYGANKFSALRAIGGILAGLIVNGSLTFFFNQYAFSRAVVLISGLLSMALVTSWRLIVKLLPHLGIIKIDAPFGRILLGKRTLVVGRIKDGLKIIEKLRERVDGGYQIIGLISPNQQEVYQTYAGIRVLGAPPQLNNIIQQERIQEVIFSTEYISYDDILELMATTRRRHVNFKLVPSNMEVIIGKASIDKIGALPLVDIDYKIDRPLSRLVKRTSDIIISLIVLMFGSPLIFYLRLVKKNLIIKKRIFAIDGESIEISEFKPHDGENITWKYLLPRFWSIFKGDISLVGSEIVDFEETHKNKAHYSLKPGLCGLVQLNKHFKLSDEDKQRYDLFYLKNFTPVLDLEIILKSIFNRK